MRLAIFPPPIQLHFQLLSWTRFAGIDIFVEAVLRSAGFAKLITCLPPSASPAPPASLSVCDPLAFIRPTLQGSRILRYYVEQDLSP